MSTSGNPANAPLPQGVRDPRQLKGRINVRNPRFAGQRGAGTHDLTQEGD